MRTKKPKSKTISMDKIKFTFYGDLLGISNLYLIDKAIAYQKLDQFYNDVYHYFHQFSRTFTTTELDIFLFSDSLFITGAKFETALSHLARLYYDLFAKQIFLRGVFVCGRLDFDPRITVRNLKKMLPKTDVLYRAITLEKTVKGARLLIEKELAKKILPNEWLTDELYQKNVVKINYPHDDIRRKIVLHKEWKSYEYLWPWSDGIGIHGVDIDSAMAMIMNPQKALSKLKTRVPSLVEEHYDETISLFTLSKIRRDITDSAFVKLRKKPKTP